MTLPWRHLVGSRSGIDCLSIGNVAHAGHSRFAGTTDGRNRASSTISPRRYAWPSTRRGHARWLVPCGSIIRAPDVLRVRGWR